MTQWNGIKVGRLYKRTGKGSRGAPLAMVVAMETYEIDAEWGPGLQLTTLEEGQLHTTYLEYARIEEGGERILLVQGVEPWPYKAVAV